jgi:hypothetical protein
MVNVPLLSATSSLLIFGIWNSGRVVISISGLSRFWERYLE